jgi:hypothetical protein
VRGELELLEHVVRELVRAHCDEDSIGITEQVNRSGVWAPTAERRRISMFLYERSGKRFVYRIGVDSHEHAAGLLREHLATAPRQPHPGSMLDELLRASGQTTRTRMLWSGYVINAATLVGLGLIGWGSVGAFVAVRARRRIGKHQCAKCRYDLRGLVVARCPECGTPLPVACGDHPPPCGEREGE